MADDSAPGVTGQAFNTLTGKFVAPHVMPDDHGHIGTHLGPTATHLPEGPSAVLPEALPVEVAIEIPVTEVPEPAAEVSKPKLTKKLPKSKSPASNKV